MATLTAAVYVLPGPVPARDVLLAAMLSLAPAAAVGGAILAVRSLPGAFGRPWLLVGAAAAISFLDQLQIHRTGRAATGELHVTLTAAAMLLLALGTGWILHQRDRGRAVEIGLDGGLVLMAATVVTFHWAPGAAQTLSGDFESLGMALGTIAVPVAALCGVLLAALLVVVRGASPSGSAGPAIAAAAVLLGLAITPLALGQGVCCAPGHISGVAWAGGWLALAYAGVRAGLGGPSEFMSAGAGAGGGRLRLVVAPAVAIVLAAVLVSASLGRPVQQATVVALGLLGLLLALRVSQLLHATRTHDAAQVELSQSRALIEVSHALSGMRELDETLKLVAYWAVQLLHARAASIELLSDDGLWLEPRAAMGLSEDALGLRFPVEQSFTGWVLTHGRARVTANASADPTMHAGSRPFLRDSPVAAVPLRYGDSTFGTLTCIGRYPFTLDDMELLGAFAEQAAVAIETSRLFRQVHQLSMTDPLTGLANRRQLEKDLAREFAAARRGRRLVAVMFDLNGFKQFNDTHGHLVGDEALRRFGAALGGETRAMNMAARYGGDEFIALLADADGRGTEIFVQRVRARFPGPGADPRFTGLMVAAGYAEYDPAMGSPSDLIAAADRALYRDKAAWAALSRAST
jgi:diguanylate cyclase (GGDEF)-like protein